MPRKPWAHSKYYCPLRHSWDGGVRFVSVCSSRSLARARDRRDAEREREREATTSTTTPPPKKKKKGGWVVGEIINGTTDTSCSRGSPRSVISNADTSCKGLPGRRTGHFSPRVKQRAVLSPGRCSPESVGSPQLATGLPGDVQ